MPDKPTLDKGLASGPTPRSPPLPLALLQPDDVKALEQTFNVIVYAAFDLSPDVESGPCWRESLIFDLADISRLGFSHVGWLLHVMFSITGTFGYFELAQVIYEGEQAVGVQWKKVENDHVVNADQGGMCFRYVASLDPRRMITWRDVDPYAHTNVTPKSRTSDMTPLESSASSSASASASVLASPPIESVDAAVESSPKIPSSLGLGQVFGHIAHISEPLDQKKFRQNLIARDDHDVSFNNFGAGVSEAAHLLKWTNPAWLLESIAALRGFAGGDPLGNWRKVGSLLDTRCGILLVAHLHKALDKAYITPVRYPNIGMLSLKDPRVFSPAVDSVEPRPPSVPLQHPPTPSSRPAALTQNNLLLHTLLPSPSDRVKEWANVKSSIYLIPLHEEGRLILPSGDIEETKLRTPESKKLQDLWPFNALVDWCMAGRILFRYGSDDFKQYSRTSIVSQEVEMYRKGLSGKRVSGLRGQKEGSLRKKMKIEEHEKVEGQAVKESAS